MTSLLSAVSGQFAKSIIMGTLFPVVIFSILAVGFVGPLVQPVPYLEEQLKRLAIGEDKWTIVVLTFVVLVLTGVLRNLNIRIIRLYEGYPWNNSWLGELFKRKKKKWLRQAQPLREQLESFRLSLREGGADAEYLATFQAQQNALARRLNRDLPDQEQFVLPTRFGNVIRCFERYSTLAYGIDAIVLWPRLVGKIGSEFASTIDEAKTSLDFMLNCSLLSSIISVVLLSMKIWGPDPLTWTTALPWLWRVVLFFILAVFFYEAAIGQANSWGEQVKSAFDLYRFDLLKSLGYEQQPSNSEEERELWQNISRQLLYADSKKPRRPYKEKDPATRVTTSGGAQVAVDRIFQQLEFDGTVPVEITVTNNDLRATAENVRIQETVPEGYVLDTTQPSPEVQVSGLNPLQFTCKSIEPGGKVTIRYVLRQS
jgi:hypothetical protein